MITEAKPSQVKLVYFKTPTYLSTIKKGIVINGGFFWKDTTLSLVIKDGKKLADNYYNRPALYAKGDKAWISHEETLGVDWAIGGGPQIVKDGKPFKFKDLHYNAGGILPGKKMPRTVVGVKDNNIVAFVLENANADECAQRAIEYGCQQAMLLDGGGSSAWIVNGEKKFGGYRPVTTALVFPFEEVSKMKVYISPSTQDRNKGIGDYGTEEYRMNKIADYIVPGLESHGFLVRRNRPNMTLQEVIYDSNAWGSDIHVAIHSNAGGGGEGTEIWVLKKGYNAERLAKAIYKYLAPLSPGKDRGIKESSYYGELRETNASAVIVEVGFHDNPKDVQWIINSYKQIAEAFVRGICDYAGVPYKPNDDELTRYKNAIEQIKKILEGLS